MSACQLRAGVMLLQSQHLQPVTAAVFHRPGDKAKVLRSTIDALTGILGDAAQLFLVRHGIDDMAGAGRDQVDQLQALFLHGTTHEHMSLEEHVLLSHASDGRDDAGVGGVVDGVEHVQGLFLVRRQRAHLDEVGQGRLRKVVRIHVATVGAEGDEAIGVLEAEVPGAGGAHGHAAEHNALAVDGIIAANGLDGLEDVGFAGPAVAVLDSAQGMQLDEVLFGSTRAGVVAVVEPAHESQLAHADGPGAAVQDDVEAAGPGRIVIGGHHEAEGLRRAVHRREIAAGQPAFLRLPGLLAGSERLDPLPAATECFPDQGHVGLAELRVVAERPGDGFVKDFRVGQEVWLRGGDPRAGPQGGDSIANVLQVAVDVPANFGSERLGIVGPHGGAGENSHFNEKK